MKLYSPPNNHKLQKILLTSKIYQQQIEQIELPFNHKNKPFMDAYPNFNVPALQISENKYVFGQHTIMLALAPQRKCQFQSVEIKQWLSVIEKQVETATGILILKQKGCKNIEEEQIGKAIDIIAKFIKKVDEKLKLKTFLVGDQLTIADISIFYNIHVVKQFIDDKIKGLSSLIRWYNYISSLL